MRIAANDALLYRAKRRDSERGLNVRVLERGSERLNSRYVGCFVKVHLGTRRFLKMVCLLGCRSDTVDSFVECS